MIRDVLGLVLYKCVSWKAPLEDQAMHRPHYSFLRLRQACVPCSYAIFLLIPQRIFPTREMEASCDDFPPRSNIMVYISSNAIRYLCSIDGVQREKIEPLVK